jgi:plasmid stability protein
VKNITITLPEDVARWLRVRAAEDDRSVSRWIRELLERKRDREDDYEIAMERYLARRPCKIDWHGERRPSRDELYVRTRLR